MYAGGVQPMIRQEPSGWWLPSADTYFKQFMPQFREGPPPKRNGFQREHLLEAFKHVRAWNIAIDVGAHVGFWCFDLAQRFKEVHAFEATVCNYQCLLENIAEFDNVQTYNMAVGDKAGFCKVWADDSRPGNTGSFYVKPDPSGDVLMRALDEFIWTGCDLLKIDVEGFELRVLQGASSLITTYHPVVSMECSDSKFHKRYGIPIGQAERWLLKRGYEEAAHMRPDKVFVHRA